jgi:hypothetical protein
MTFAPLRVGGWAFGQILTSADMNQLNEDLPFAIDGRAGGTYAPTGPIVINGDGTLLVGTLASVAELIVSEGATVVNGISTDTLTATGAVSGGSLTTTGAVSGANAEFSTCLVTGNSEVEGDRLVHGNDVVDGSQTVVGSLTVVSNAQFESDATVDGKTFALQGVIKRRGVCPDTAGVHMFSPLNYDMVDCSGISANRTVQIDDTNAVAGMMMRFYHTLGVGFTATVNSPFGAAFSHGVLGPGGGNFIDVIRTSSANTWLVIGYGAI